MELVWFTLLCVGAVLAMLRCWLGPEWTDRVLTFDLLNNILIAATALYGVVMDNAEVVSLVLLLAPLSFLSNVFFVFLLERKKEL